MPTERPVTGGDAPRFSQKHIRRGAGSPRDLDALRREPVTGGGSLDLDPATKRDWRVTRAELLASNAGLLKAVAQLNETIERQAATIERLGADLDTAADWADVYAKLLREGRVFATHLPRCTLRQADATPATRCDCGFSEWWTKWRAALAEATPGETVT
jgi:hypothetical protein